MLNFNNKKPIYQQLSHAKALSQHGINEAQITAKRHIIKIITALNRNETLKFQALAGIRYLNA